MTSVPLALDVSDTVGGISVLFWLPIVALAVALALKLPSLVRMWRDPMLRAVGTLLLFACAVFVFASPSVIGWTNRVTGVPNVAAPLVYSLLTALCASWLLLIVAWRNGLSERSAATRRAVRRVVLVYASVVAALWMLFLFADVPVERRRDLDTYYATTPFMREQILLYLCAHTVACSVTAWLIWNWVRTDGLDAWLRWGLRLLGIGYASNLLFGAAKLTAVTARLTGHDLDGLSTDLAPTAASVSATLVAVGFILPHAGQYLQERQRLRLGHRALRPLYLLLREKCGGGVRFTPWSTAEMRLLRRETFVRDSLLQLSRYLDERLRERSYAAALRLGHPPDRARSLAAAVMVLEAVAARKRSPETGSGDTPSASETAYLLQEVRAVSRALGDRPGLAAVHARATRSGRKNVAA
ncbi:MAB_1171c family putative transporter [Streptomyces sp. CRN 30]|uniref:MAB_1171c family putative transporter n=1 Tax=Streptomyces sp. CRN 30 TaxID=3075613 RepID=UPI002A7F59E0|nr:MAB_1171c family putative transporter [Streptomyces sp. CRN 30]